MNKNKVENVPPGESGVVQPNPRAVTVVISKGTTITDSNNPSSPPKGKRWRLPV
jgi:hypothetical protein